MSNTKFNLVVDERFIECCDDDGLTPIEKKNLLSFCNEFEEGQWDAKRFHRFIWNNIAETALTKEERESLIGDSATVMGRAAARMRLTENETAETRGAASELAEIFLYGIMRKHFEAIPVVPKIFYKQNNQDNAKGADSVHLTIQDGDYQIWYGEAKFYNSIADARLAQIITSVANSLHPDKIRKENSIIVGTCDLGEYVLDENLLNQIKHTLDEDTTIDRIKPKLHIPIFILHECEKLSGKSDYNDALKEDLISHHRERANSFFKKQIELLEGISKYSEISFTLILFPVPKKDDIVNSFIQRVEQLKTF